MAGMTTSSAALHHRLPAAGMAAGSLSRWKVAQIVCFGLGLALWLTLWLKPALGLTLFWNVLIPVAPALLVVAAGVWRNICPLATVSHLPQNLGWSRRRRAR